MTSYWGWRIDTWISSLTPRPYYSLGLLLTEGVTALHMIRHRRSIYHVIYGDTDLWLLSQFPPIARNRVVATFHEPPSTLGFMKVDDRLVENLAGVILISESQRSYFDGLLPKDRIFVVHHGVDTQFFQPRERLDDEPVCITVGSHLRDFETLQNAMNLVWQENPNVRLIAVGTRRSKDPNPQFQCTDDRITFLDNIRDEELLRAYQKACVAVFSFRDVTATNGMLEAMACGIPIVTTDAGGALEYLGLDAGVACAPGDPRSFADNILRILGTPDLAARMSRACRVRALAFDYQVAAEKMNQVYSEICRRTTA